MTRAICIANQKGGVGKTTTAISLAACFARSGARTLLVDLDPQCNATGGLGLSPSPRHPFVFQDESLRKSIRGCAEDFDVLPGCRSFADVERLASVREPAFFKDVARRLSRETRDYDFALIDCPPSLGPLTQAALAWSNEVFTPIQCEYFAMEGLVQMIEVIGRAMKSSDRSLEYGGVILTMCDPSLELTYEVENEVRDFFGEVVFKTTIPRDVAVAEAPSHGKSIIDYAPRSRGARAYVELSLEVLERV
ncbi:MAG: ParA family protein [Thermoguttaceae bacterium]|nr:ParA family protein [Thermoguttaceae bacterium]